MLHYLWLVGLESCPEWCGTLFLCPPSLASFTSLGLKRQGPGQLLPHSATWFLMPPDVRWLLGASWPPFPFPFISFSSWVWLAVSWSQVVQFHCLEPGKEKQRNQTNISPKTLEKTVIEQNENNSSAASSTARAEFSTTCKTLCVNIFKLPCWRKDKTQAASHIVQTY